MAKTKPNTGVILGVVGAAGLLLAFSGNKQTEQAPASPAPAANPQAKKMKPGGFVPTKKVVKRAPAKKAAPAPKPKPKPLTKKEARKAKAAERKKNRQAKRASRNTPEARAARTAKTLAVLEVVNTAAQTAASFKK